VTKLEEDHYFYTLWLDEATDRYYFETAIELTKKEIAQYERDSEAVRQLAQEVVDSPDQFIERRVSVPHHR